MDQLNGENNRPEPPPNFPAKRKRGRPRKDPSQGATRRINTQIPPAPEKLSGPKSFQLDATEDSDNGTVGQPVTGVVESSFGAGYLLSVRIGNSGTNLRGVVFKPGHYVPVSAENDVAPHVQMIRRNEISLPLVNQASTCGHHHRSRGRNARHVAAMQPLDSAPQVSFLSGQYAENGSFNKVGDKVSSVGQVESSAPQVAQGNGGSDDKYLADDVEEPLDVMPLQAIHTYVHNQQPQPAQNPLEVQFQRPRKMTELLQAMQENAHGNPLLEAKNMMTGDNNPQA